MKKYKVVSSERDFEGYHKEIANYVEAEGYDTQEGILTLYGSSHSIPSSINGMDYAYPSLSNPILSFSPGSWLRVELIKE